MVFLFKQKTAYEMRISDWSSDVCSSDLHGKTALLHALTGQQGDRRREERERGITIDLGYLYADLGEGSLTGFIDVPGHERFVHNMLAGASGKIGRASGGERVCQDGEISGVAVLLKKKQ